MNNFLPWLAPQSRTSPIPRIFNMLFAIYKMDTQATIALTLDEVPQIFTGCLIATVLYDQNVMAR